MSIVTVVGSINMDIICIAPRLPREHEKLRGDTIQLSPGGSAANTARWLAHLGVDVGMVGTAGDDEFGRACLHALGAAGVDTGLVTLEPDMVTGTAVVWSTPTDKRMITSGPVKPAPLPPVKVGSDQLLHVARRDSADLARYCHDALMPGAQLSIEFNGRTMEHSRDLASIGFMNHDELHRLTGQHWSDLDDTTLRTLLPRPGAQLVVTLGPAGAALLAEGSPPLIERTDPVAVTDRTGGGDAFNAGYLAGHVRGLPARSCLQQGLTHAARALQMIGAGPA